MNDLLELLDYISLAAIVAAVPPLVPRQEGWLRRLAWAPLVCVGVWFALVAVLFLSRNSLGESYAWIIYSALVSVTFACIGAAVYLAWAIWIFVRPPVTRLAVALYLGFTLFPVAIAVQILVIDQWRGVAALAMLLCALAGAGIKLLSVRARKGSP